MCCSRSSATVVVSSLQKNETRAQESTGGCSLPSGGQLAPFGSKTVPRKNELESENQHDFRLQPAALLVGVRCCKCTVVSFSQLHYIDPTAQINQPEKVNLISYSG